MLCCPCARQSVSYCWQCMVLAIYRYENVWQLCMLEECTSADRTEACDASNNRQVIVLLHTWPRLHTAALTLENRDRVYPLSLLSTAGVFSNTWEHSRQRPRQHKLISWRVRQCTKLISVECHSADVIKQSGHCFTLTVVIA